MRKLNFPLSSAVFIFCTLSYVGALSSYVPLHRNGPIRTLLIDNFDSYTYNLWQILAEVNGVEPYVIYNNAYDSNWEEMIMHVPSFHNIVLSPGPGSPDNSLDFGLCYDAILKSRVPLFGVCLGHQGLAYAYGGKVVKAAQPMHGRLSHIKHDEKSLFFDQEQETSVVRYHSLTVDENSMPQELFVSARSSDGTVMGLSHRHKPQFGVQFHPESIRTQAGRRYFENFKEVTRTFHNTRLRGTRSEVLIKAVPKVSFPMNKIDKRKRNRIVYANKIDARDISIEPIDVFEALFGSKAASFFLDSGLVNFSSHSHAEIGRTRNAISFFGAIEGDQSYVLEYFGGGSLRKRYATENKTVEVVNKNIFEHLRALLETNTNVQNTFHGGNVFNKDELPFNITGALFGYLSYELGMEAEHILSNERQTWESNFNLTCCNTRSSQFNNKNYSTSCQPLAVLMFPSAYIAFDHNSKSYYVLSSSDDLKSNEQEIIPAGESLSARLKTALLEENKLRHHKDNLQRIPATGSKKSMLTASKSKREYQQDIATALTRIKNGDTYEVCLTVQFTGKEPADKSPLDIYRTLRKRNPAPYACYVHYDPSALHQGHTIKDKDKSALHLEWCPEGGMSICSSSPERFLRIDEDFTMTSKPIKGTAMRDLRCENQDRLIRDALAADEKCQAENLMIVDLVRNDFGRVCQVGSVTVPKLMDIETFATVHQMVSTIQGKLRTGFDTVDAIVATFPGGSMTGAPKKRTMEIIRQLEQRPRGVYSGAMGYIALNGMADLSIVIRTAFMANGSLTVGAGGAIVALSDPEMEIEEVLLKANSVGNSIGCSVQFAGD